MKNSIYLVWLLGCILTACSKPHGDPLPGSTSIQSMDVTVLGKKDNELIQFDILAGDNDIKKTNLTKTMGVQWNTQQSISDSFLLSFIKGYSVYQKDLKTGNLFEYNDICAGNDNEAINNIEFSDGNIVFVGFEVDLDATVNFTYNNLIKIYNKQTGNCTRIRIGTPFVNNQRTKLSSSAIKNETLFLKYRDYLTSTYVILSIDLNTQAIQGELVLEDASNFHAVIVDDEFHIYYEDLRHEVYNASNFKLLHSSSLEKWLPLGRKSMFVSQSNGNTILLDIPYPQPGAILQGPGIFNLETGNCEIGLDLFLFDVRTKLSDSLQTYVDLLDFSVSKSQEVIVCSFVESGIEDVGIIVYTNFDGDILKVVNVPALPMTIIVR